MREVEGEGDRWGGGVVAGKGMGWQERSVRKITRSGMNKGVVEMRCASAPRMQHLLHVWKSHDGPRDWMRNSCQQKIVVALGMSWV